MTLAEIGRRMSKFAVDNSPSIMTAIGVTGAVTTAYLTGKASFRAALILSEESPHLEARDKVAMTWKLYIPAISTGAITIAAIICANRIGVRRTAALAAAYSLSEKAFEEYRVKIVEKLGARKEETARDEIAQERVNRQPPENREIIVTGNGSVLCMDAFSGRYFLCTVEEIRKAENDINHQIVRHDYASLTDFYDLIGLPATSISDHVGWNNDKILEVHFSGTITPGNQKPCVVVNYTVGPVRDFDRLH